MSDYISEADALADWEDDTCLIDDDDEYTDDDRRFNEEVKDGIISDEFNYTRNKKAKVGTKITCAGPLCHKKFKKKSYQQTFCCSHCKDQFWNRREAYYGYKKPIKI